MGACRRFPKAARLLRPTDFDSVFATRASAAAEGLVLHAGRNDAGVPRLGVSVSRRVGNAVVRNGWKRRLREAFRRIRADLPVADYVVVVKSRVVPRGAAGASRVERTLAALATQAARRCGHAGGTNR